MVAIGFASSLTLSLPLFIICASTDNFAIIIPMMLIFIMIEPFVSAAVYTSVAELFPARTRYTGTSIGFIPA